MIEAVLIAMVAAKAAVVSQVEALRPAPRRFVDAADIGASVQEVQEPARLTAPKDGTPCP